MVITDIRTGRDRNIGPQDAPFSVRLDEWQRVEIQNEVERLASEDEMWPLFLTISRADFQSDLFYGEETNIAVMGDGAHVETALFFSDEYFETLSNQETCFTDDEALETQANLESKGYVVSRASADNRAHVLSIEVGDAYSIQMGLGFVLADARKNRKTQKVFLEMVNKAKSAHLEHALGEAMEDGEEEELGILFGISKKTADGKWGQVPIADLSEALQVYSQIYPHILEAIYDAKGMRIPEGKVILCLVEE